MAAARAKAFSFLDEELTCPVCLEQFTDPVLLSCSHTLCRKCIRDILENCSSIYQGFTCPCCRKPCNVYRQQLAELPKNLLIENIISNYEEISTKPHIETAGNADNDEDKDNDQENTDDVACDICIDTAARQAKFLCRQCNVLYCTECIEKLHPKIGVLAWHRLEPATAKRSLKLCRDHLEKNTIFCKSCGILVCHLCICKDVGKHVSHEIIDKETAAQQIKKKASNTNNDIDILCDKLSKQKSTLSQLNCRVEEKYKDIADKINKQQKSFMDDILLSVNDFLTSKNLDHEKNLLVSRINALEGANGQAEHNLASFKKMCKTLETSDLDYLLNSFKDFETVIQNVKKCQEDTTKSLKEMDNVVIADDESRYVDDFLVGLTDVVADMMKVCGSAAVDGEPVKFYRCNNVDPTHPLPRLGRRHLWYIRFEWNDINQQDTDIIHGIGVSSKSLSSRDPNDYEKFSYGVVWEKDVLYFSRKGERKELCPLTLQPITVLLKVLVNDERQCTTLGYNILNTHQISIISRSTIILDKELAQNIYLAFQPNKWRKILYNSSEQSSKRRHMLQNGDRRNFLIDFAKYYNQCDDYYQDQCDADYYNQCDDDYYNKDDADYYNQCDDDYYNKDDDDCYNQGDDDFYNQCEEDAHNRFYTDQDDEIQCDYDD